MQSSKSPETSQKSISEYIKNTERKKFTRGATPCPRGWGARPPTSWAPGGPPMAIFFYMKSFNEEKIISHLLRRNSAAMRRNLGGTNLGLWRSCSAGDTSLREGEIIAIAITNNPLIRRGSISINNFTSTNPGLRDKNWIQEMN